MSRLSIAACISGAPHSLVDPRLLAHWTAAFAPLRSEALHLDVLLHLDGASHSLTDLQSVASSLQAVSLQLYDNNTLSSKHKFPTSTRYSRALDPQLRRIYANVSDAQCRGPVRCVSTDVGLCMTTGYDQSVKWRGCLRDVEQRERARGEAYTFVLRVRPDLEFGEAFPDASGWLRLRHDVVMTMVANGEKGGRRGRAVTDRVSSVDDNLALLPRHAASAYLSIADSFERCIPYVPTMSICGGRWQWAECRVLQALLPLNLSFAEWPPTHEWAIVDASMSQGKDGKLQLTRRSGIATVWGGAHHPEHPFLSTALRPSFFPPGALYDDPS